MRTFYAGVFIVIISLTQGCKNSRPATTPRVTSTAPASPRAAAAPEFLEAGKGIETAIMTQDLPALQNLVDTEAITRVVTAGVSAPAAAHTMFHTNLKIYGLGALFTIPKAGGTYHLLHVVNGKDKAYAIFRITEGGLRGLNYHKWALERCPDGKIRANDAYVADAGELLTQSWRRDYILAAGAADKTLIPSFSREEQEAIAYVPDYMRMVITQKNGNDRGALTIYHHLPQSQQDSRIFLQVRLKAAWELSAESPAEYESAVADVERLFPRDPGTCLLRLNVDIAAKNYPAIYGDIDRLEQWTGGDPYLQTIRAQQLMREGKPAAPAEAERLVRAASMVEPALTFPRFVMIQALAAQGKYPGAVAAVEEYESLRGAPLPDKYYAPFNHLTTSQPYVEYRAKSAHH